MNGAEKTAAVTEMIREKNRDADKMIALQAWARQRGHKDIDPVSQWLLLHRDRDIRSLMAYLDALDRYALQTRRPLTIRLLHEFERNRLPDNGA